MEFDLIILLSEMRLYKGVRKFGAKSSQILLSQWIIGVFK
jgi:hypothetical protein